MKAKSPAANRSHVSSDPGANHLRRIELVLLASSYLLVVLSLNWVVFFGLRHAWLITGLHVVAAFIGLLTAALTRRNQARLASYLLVGSLLLICGFTSAVLDVPSNGIPRTAHLYFLALGMGSSFVFKGEHPWLRHGMTLACFGAFLVFAGSNSGILTAYALPESVRTIGTWVNGAGALVALYSLLHIMQTDQIERSALESELQKALLRHELQLLYQPQITESGLVVGAEALVRWKHPVRGMVSPAEFIPVAERSGLILPLGDWVLRTACAQLVAWAAHPETAGLTLSVNVSAKQFHENDFVDHVLSVAERFEINPALLKLELTESMLADDIDDIVRKMTALKARGIGFSLDDFGTGFSSLNYLKRLPLDQLKIDQSFVGDVLTDPNDAAIACAIITLGQSLGLDVIAEGVETEAQREFLSNNGCHTYQGYLFSRPLEAQELEAFVHTRVPQATHHRRHPAQGSLQFT
ncbi:MAG TPA: EAL domain-containing protein [Burkholderiaceae bacterium]|nr:EAL domain-containing protein [Burkholderiaceae bacterium]